jgi:hypothetical protein
MLQCPKCGYDNELGRIFCHQCGNKLELDQIKPPSEGAKMRRKVAGGVRKIVRTIIEVAIAVGLVAIVVLLCLVPEVNPVKPTGGELAAADVKRRALDRLVAGRRAGNVVINEVELDAYLNTLGLEKPKDTGIEVAPVTVRTDFDEGTVTIHYLGEIRLGSAVRKQVYFGLKVSPQASGGSFTLKPTGGWIGKLPIQPKLIELTGLFPGVYRKLFVKLEDEQKSLDKLSSVTVTPEHATLGFEPAPAK